MTDVLQRNLEMLREDPESDEVRLVAADAYEDQGQLDRANLIRLQLERASLPPWDARLVELELRERALLAANEQRWRGELPQFDDVHWGRFERGFVRNVAFDTVAALNRRLADCLAACPIYGLVSRWPSSTEREPIPVVEGLRELTIVGTIMNSEDMKWLADSPGLSTVRALNLVETGLGADALELLLASPHLAQLRALRMPLHNFGNAGVETLTRSKLPNLIELDLSVATEDELGSGGRYQDTMDAEGIAMLASWSCAKQLRSLSLTGNQITEAGVATLVTTPHFVNLEALRLCSIGDWDFDADDGKPDVLQPFANAAAGLRLDVLDVGENNVLAAAAALAQSPALRELKMFHLNRALADGDLDTLLDAPWMDSIRLLSSNDGVAGLQPLLNRAPKQLHSLNLRSHYYWSQPETVAAILDAAPPDSPLLHLDLGACRFSDEELRALGQIGSLPSLLSLRIFEPMYEDDEPEFSEEAAAELAQSPFGSRLKSLTLGYATHDRLPPPARYSMGCREYSGPLQYI